jgi:hypothetical protein
MRTTFAKTTALLITALLLWDSTGTVGWSDSPAPKPEITFLGVVTFPTGYMFRETQVGGMSGIAYDPAADHYLAVSDDRGRFHPARFYTLTIDLADGRLEPGDVIFTGVTFLKDAQGQPFTKGGIDPEAIAVTKQKQIYIASEGHAKKGLAPFVNGFTVEGKQMRQLPVPKKFLPGARSGIRDNLAFESLALTPDQRYLFTAVENALLQDGPEADLAQPSPARIVKYDLTSGRVAAEYVYPVAAVAKAPQPADGPRGNGLVELLAMDDHGTLLALERCYSKGVGVTARLYRASTQAAADVSRLTGLKEQSEEAVKPVSKTEIADFSQWLLWIDNLEGMTFGPNLADGRRTLIVVSDNNFDAGQMTQFIALALQP